MNGKWIMPRRSDTAVVFVHGFLSSGEACWKNENGCYWPDLLVRQSNMPDVGVYVFTYQTNAFSGTYRIADVVDALKEHLDLDGVMGCSCIVFVCHSMGGIVVRKYWSSA